MVRRRPSRACRSGDLATARKRAVGVTRITLRLNGAGTYLQARFCRLAQWKRRTINKNRRTDCPSILCAPDNFETYQDRYGRQAANQSLRQIAQILQSTVNPNIDLVARYSDGAFGIVLPTTSLDGALRVANRIQGRRRGQRVG